MPLANIGQSSAADSHLLQMMPLSRIFYEDLDLRLGRKKKKWNMINIITLAVTFDKKVTGFKLTKSNQDKKPLE